MLKIKPENKGGGSRVRPGVRLYYTADRSRVVEEGDPEAASLYCSAFKEVPRAELEALLPDEPESAEPEDQPEPEPGPEEKPEPKPRAPKKRASKRRSSK